MNTQTQSRTETQLPAETEPIIQLQVISNFRCLQHVGSPEEFEAFCAKLNRLLPMLSERPMAYSKSSLETLFKHDGQLVLALDKNENIVGMGTFRLSHDGIQSTSHIDNVVVDIAFQKQGIAGRIMDCLMKLAESSQVERINLTSHPSRIAANILYQKKGFERVETNVYRYTLNRNQA